MVYPTLAVHGRNADKLEALFGDTAKEDVYDERTANLLKLVVM